MRGKFNNDLLQPKLENSYVKKDHNYIFISIHNCRQSDFQVSRYKIILAPAQNSRNKYVLTERILTEVLAWTCLRMAQWTDKWRFLPSILNGKNFISSLLKCMNSSILASLNCMGDFVLAFLKFTDGSVWKHLNGIYNSVWSHLRFSTQSNPTIFPQSGKSVDHC